MAWRMSGFTSGFEQPISLVSPYSHTARPRAPALSRGRRADGSQQLTYCGWTHERAKGKDYDPALSFSGCEDFALEGPGAAQLFTKAFHLRERVQENYYTADIYYTMEHLPSMDASRNEVAFLDLRGNPGLHTPGFVRSATASKQLSLLRDHESGLSFAPLAFRAGFRGWLTA